MAEFEPRISEVYLNNSDVGKYPIGSFYKDGLISGYIIEDGSHFLSSHLNKYIEVCEVRSVENCNKCPLRSTCKAAAK